MMGWHRATRSRPRRKSPYETEREKKIDGFYKCRSLERNWEWVKPTTCRRCKEHPVCVEKNGKPTAYLTYVSEVMQGLREPLED